MFHVSKTAYSLRVDYDDLYSVKGSLGNFFMRFFWADVIGISANHSRFMLFESLLWC